jgi:hypothetical protein
MNIIFKMRGFSAAMEQFANIVPKMAEEMSTASRDGVLAVQNSVIPRIPVDTGQTRNAFADPDAIGHDADGSWQFGLLTPELVRRGYRAKFIEFGTKGHGAIPAQPARPFVRPGAEATRDEIIARQRAAMQAAIDRQAKELRRDDWFDVFNDSASAWQRGAFIENLKEGIGLGPKPD